MNRLLLLLAGSAVVGACASTPSVDMGTAQAGTYTFTIAREGDAPAAGVSTRFVLKATAGGMPTSVKGWVGLADAAATLKTAAVYDPGDGDFDDDVTIPSPMPANSMFWFDVDTNGTVVTTSVALK